MPVHHPVAGTSAHAVHQVGGGGGGGHGGEPPHVRGVGGSGGALVDLQAARLDRQGALFALQVVLDLVQMLMCAVQHVPEEKKKSAIFYFTYRRGFSHELCLNRAN